MSNTTDAETRNQPRRPAQPSRKQPTRASSSRSQPEATHRGWPPPGVDVLSGSRTPVFAPPISDTQFDTLSSVTARLDISKSSLSQSDTVSSTQLTSVSRHQKSSEKSNKAKGSDTDDFSIEKRTRSRSPVKKIVDLSAARPPIRYNPSEVPEEVGKILKRFKKVFKGRHLMPVCLKDEIRSLEPSQFYDTEDEFDQCSSQPTAEDRKILKRLTKIRDNARTCSRLSKPEPSWGNEVFKPLLDLAVKLENIDNNGQKVQTEDITTIPVSSRCLPLGIYDGSLQAKRIDYGIYLSQNDDQRQLLRAHLEARNVAPEDLCVNQAPVYAEYIRWLPQLLAVETKTGEPSGVSAEAQLAIWMAGLRNRLDGFVRLEDGNFNTSQSRLKPMPCLKIQGFEWKMFWCSVNGTGETILHGPQELGTTQTLLGAYRILAGLREIIQYGRDEYAPWAMKECFW